MCSKTAAARRRSTAQQEKGELLVLSNAHCSVVDWPHPTPPLLPAAASRKRFTVAVVRAWKKCSTRTLFMHRWAAEGGIVDGERGLGARRKWEWEGARTSGGRYLACIERTTVCYYYY